MQQQKIDQNYQRRRITCSSETKIESTLCSKRGSDAGVLKQCQQSELMLKNAAWHADQTLGHSGILSIQWIRTGDLRWVMSTIHLLHIMWEATLSTLLSHIRLPQRRLNLERIANSNRVLNLFCSQFEIQICEFVYSFRSNAAACDAHCAMVTPNWLVAKQGGLLGTHFTVPCGSVR